MAYYGTSGQFGGGNQNPQFGNWSSQAPNPWDQPWWQKADPAAAIQGAQNDIRRASNDQFNRAASYMGNTGTVGGGPARNTYGGIATDASRQMAEIANKYTYDAAQQEANRRTGAWDASQNRELSWNQLQQQLGFNREQAAQQQQADWWRRYQDWYYQGGSPENLNYWQSAGMPLAQNYMNSFQR